VLLNKRRTEQWVMRQADFRNIEVSMAVPQADSSTEESSWDCKARTVLSWALSTQFATNADLANHRDSGEETD
jgi:hypothetical protein